MFKRVKQEGEALQAQVDTQTQTIADLRADLERQRTDTASALAADLARIRAVLSQMGRPRRHGLCG